jgi:hypothetical protein
MFDARCSRERRPQNEVVQPTSPRAGEASGLCTRRSVVAVVSAPDQRRRAAEQRAQPRPRASAFEESGHDGSLPQSAATGHFRPQAARYRPARGLALTEGTV